MRSKLLSGILSLFSFLAVAASGDFEELMKQSHAALAKFDPDAARAVLSQACESPVSSSKTAICETESGAIEEAAGHAEAAEAHYRRALLIWKQLGPDHAIYHATTLMDLGSLCRTEHHAAESEALLTQAYAMVLNQVTTQVTTADRDRLLAVITSRLGGLYSESGAPERGRSLLNQAISMLRTPALSNPAALASALNSLGLLDLRAGAYKVGESNLREAVSVATDALGDSYPDTAVYEANLALALSLEGQSGRAEVLLNRARYIVETRLPAGNPRFGAILGTILAELTTVETVQGQFARAEDDGKQSLAILSRGREPESPEIIADKVMLAALYLRERKIAEAEKILPKAIALERQWVGDSRMPDRRILADGIRRLGELRALQRNWQDAQMLYSEAIAIYESTLGPGHPGIAPMLVEYADALKHCGAPRAEVKSIEARASAIKT